MTAGESAETGNEDGAPLAPFLELRARLAASVPAGGGPEICRQLSEAMDACLLGLAGRMPAGRLAIVAVGGYGRRELCLYSDIDLMLLHAGRLPPKAAEMAFYPLWDAGLKVGHAVRSVKEAVAAAAEQLATLTALMDARAVTGDASLVAEMLFELGKRLRNGQIPLAAPLRATEQRRRELEPYQLQETDLKEGRGGLRALQSVHWLRRFQVLTDASASVTETAGERTARAELLSTRNALHAVSGRAFDRYVPDLRGPSAAWLELEPREAGRRLFLAMRDVDTVVNDAWSLEPDEVVTVAAATGGARSPAARLTTRFGGRTPSKAEPPSELPARLQSTSPLVIAAGTLGRPESAAVFTPEESDLIRTGGSTAWDAGEREAFTRILRAGERGWRVFTALQHLGWVTRLLPEWRHVIAAPQEAPFHLHPLDTHLWRTVIELLTISRPESEEAWCHEVARDLGSLDDALWAALLHDIGKGWPGDHSTEGARAVAALLRRARMGPSVAGTVSAVVRHHLLLPNTATRRDIDDPRVVAQVADRAGDLRTLRMLYLLSVADSRATGPSVWSPWKAQLLSGLFTRAAAELERRAGSLTGAPSGAGIAAAVKELVAGRVDESLVAEHLQAMPAGYVIAFSASDLARHIEAMVPAPAPDSIRLDVRPTSFGANVLVVAEDRPGLLSLVSGVFALHNISILDGHFFTRADGIVLDVFHVADALGNPIDERRWERVRLDTTRAIRGELDLEPLLREKARAYRRPEGATIGAEVVFDTGASDRFTVVEVHCSDRVGLLHQIAVGLFELGLDIHVAKVDTQGRTIVDTFYVRDLEGETVRDRTALAKLAQRLRQRLDAAV